MNHRRSQRKLNRTSSHRRAMQRNLAQSLFEHGEVRTTVPKAKDLRPFAERLITLAKRALSGNLTARRRIHQLMGDRQMIPAEHREAYAVLSDAKRRQVRIARSGRLFRTGAARGGAGFTAEMISHRLITSVAARYADREGGYTRLIPLSDCRLGDKARLAIVQLVGGETAPTGVAKARKGARKVRQDGRYAAVAKAAKDMARAVRGQGVPADRANVEGDTASEST